MGGTKQITWSKDEEVDLFVAVLAVHDIKIDYAKVATAFRAGLPATSISWKISKMRKLAAAKGLQAQPTTVTANPGAVARAPAVARVTSKVSPAANKRKRGGKRPDDSDDEGSMGAGETTDEDKAAVAHGLRTPEPELKRVKRSSPRSLAKKDYKALDDPYTSMATEDAEGNVVFENEGTSEEYSADEDGEYGKTSAVTVTA